MHDVFVRTTLTIDELLAEQIRKEVKLGKLTLKTVKPYRVEAHSSAFALGVDAGRLNQSVDELEFAEFLTKHQPKP